MASSTPFPVNVLALVLLLAWVYPSLCLAQRIKGNPLVPNQYKSAVQVVSVFAGPIVFLMLVLAEKKKFDSHVNPVVGLLLRAHDTLLDFWQGGQEEPEQKHDTVLQLFDSSGTELSEIYGHSNGRQGDRKVLDLTAWIIDDALKQRASDILIDPLDRATYAVRLRIDGALRTVQSLPIETCKAVINSVKAVSNMDIAERRRPQDGAFTAGMNGSTVSFRVASAGALNGEKLSIRVLNQNAGKITMADIGIPEGKRAAICQAIGQPSGMIMICGPTGSGKTTTLYAMLNEIDRMTRNVITVEDPIEAHLPGVSQLEINARADITFAKALRSMLRQDPDVILRGRNPRRRNCEHRAAGCTDWPSGDGHNSLRQQRHGAGEIAGLGRIVGTDVVGTESAAFATTRAQVVRRVQGAGEVQGGHRATTRAARNRHRRNVSSQRVRSLWRQRILRSRCSVRSVGGDR